MQISIKSKMLIRGFFNVDIKNIISFIDIFADWIVNTVARIEKIPWYWIGLFTSLVLLIISILMINYIPDDHRFFAQEYGAVGAALAQGRGFSDPFSIGSGATAWVSPLLPGIIGLIFYITNFHLTVAYGMLLLIKVFSLGFGAGLIWAVLQKSNRGFALVCYFWMMILFSFHKIGFIYQYHDDWLIFFIISLAFWGWYKQSELRGQIVLIVAFSAAALSNPIVWIAFCILILVYKIKAYVHYSESNDLRVSRRESVFSKNALLIAIIISFLFMGGWTVRNWIQLNMFAPVKSNAGYEIFQSQIVSKNGIPNYSTFTKHPINRESNENKVYAEVGETDFVRMRRDMAIQSIAADPGDFSRRVAQRFSNAFLYTALPSNVALVSSKICSDDLERLRKAGFVAYHDHKKLWIDLDDPDNDLKKVLPSIGLTNPQLVEDNWQSMLEGNYWYRFSWEQIIGGCLIGGMPWIALFIAILMRRRSELMPGILWAGFFLLLYLMPYVLISHYMRYQVPLLGMQAILLTAGTLAILRALKQTPLSSKHQTG
jgi:hypothetical protein